MNADFRRLWVARTVSRFGSLLGALPYTAIFFLGASPGQMALLGVARMTPGFAGGLVAGVIADRMRRRPLMILADAGRAATLLTVFAAAVAGKLTFPHLYAAAFLIGALEVLSDVAAVAYLPAVVGRESILKANSQLVAADAVVEATSFSAGGWIVQLASAPAAVLVDAGTFVVSAIGLGAIRMREEATPERPDGRGVRGIVGETREGARFMWEDSTLRAIAASIVFRSLGYGLVGAVILVFVANELDFSPGAMGLIFAVGGISSFAGATVATRITAVIGHKRAMIAGLAIGALGTALVPLAGVGAIPATLLLVGAQLVGDGAHTLYEVNQESTRQTIVPDDLLGRIEAAVRVLGLGAMLAGTAAGGLVGETVGSRAALVAGVGAHIAGAAALFAMPRSALR